MLHNKIRAFFFMAVVSVIMTACSKKEDAPSPTGSTNVSFKEYISKESNITIFNAAFTRSGMEQDSVYLSGGPYTFFVPVDSAFVAQSMSLEVVKTMDKARLLEMLKYMIVKGRVSSATLAGFFRQSASTLTVNRPILTKNYYGIFFNGIAMREANISLGDAIVHKMNRLAFPPKDSVLELIATIPELSIFSAIISRSLNAGFRPYYGDLRNMFRSTNGKTIFAPTNDAFISYGIPSVEYVKNIADTEMLAALVRSQVHIGTYTIDPRFASDNSAYSCTVSDFKGGYMLNGLGMGSFIFPSVREDGLTIMTAVNYPNPRIIKTDLLAIDGVVQEIDQVLLLK